MYIIRKEKTAGYATRNIHSAMRKTWHSEHDMIYYREMDSEPTSFPEKVYGMKRILKKIKKRENVYLFIGTGDLGGNYRYGEVRQYTVNADGTFEATTKGFTFPPQVLPELIAGLQELEEWFRINGTP